MSDSPSPTTDPADRTLVEGVLASEPQAIAEFIGRFREPLTAVLWARSSAPRARQRADEMVEEVLGDCTSGGDTSLLSKFSFRGNLEGWVKRVAVFRFLNWIEKDAREIPSDDPTQGQPGAAETPETEQEVLELLREAVARAFAQLEENHPRELVFMKLHFLYGVEKQVLAKLWNRHPSQAGKYVTAGLETMQQAILTQIRGLDPNLRLDWEDFVALAARHPKLAHGIF